MKSAYLECKSNNAAWFHLRARNGQIVMTSETYASKWNCKRAALRWGKALGLPVRVRWEKK